MADNQSWRLVLRDGTHVSVSHNEAFNRACDWENVREIVPPGEASRAELRAELERVRGATAEDAARVCSEIAGRYRAERDEFMAKGDTSKAALAQLQALTAAECAVAIQKKAGKS